MITIKQLHGSDLIDDACALLYLTLIEQIYWNFLPDNPSKLRVEIKNSRHLLVDRFTNNAIWFGAYDDARLIGCLRATFPDENDRLEVEGYESSHIIQKYLPVGRKNCVELTRAAILSSYYGTGVLRPLFLAMFQYCEAHQYSVCGASSNICMISLFKKIGFPLKIKNAFKYEEQDPALVNFYFADYNKSEIKNIILNLAPLEEEPELF